MTTAMWGVVARIAAAAAILTLVQHNISQMYKAYYDERMKEEAGPTKMFPKREEDADGHDDNGGARSARGGGGSRGERGRTQVVLDRHGRVRRRVGRRGGDQRRAGISQKDERDSERLGRHPRSKTRSHGTPRRAETQIAKTTT